MPRLPEFDETKLTEAQKAVYERISSGPRGGVRGPFKALLQAPELGDLVQAVGGRIQRYFDRDWRGDDVRSSRLVIIGQHGLDEAAISAALRA